MEKNTDKGVSVKHSNNQSEIDPDEASSTVDMGTYSLRQEAENMEACNNAHQEGNKNWKSYIREFLMLFLAVFCGFLAENQRESIAEHKREIQFMRLLVRDLKKDTAILNSSFPLKETRIKSIDSVFTFFEKNSIPNEIPGYVFNQMRRTTFDQLIARNKSTIDQMKSSGNLRLIRIQNVADSLVEYDMLWDRAGLWQEMYLKRQDENLAFLHKIISGSSLIGSYLRDTTASFLREAPSIKIHPEYLDEYYNYLNRQRGTTRNDIRIFKRIYNCSIRLIDLINKEYNLE